MWTRSSWTLAVILLCLRVLRSTDALVCYDNLQSGNKTLRIGCDFYGAACATTILKKNISVIFKKVEIKHVYYHCAKRSSTCKFGPSKLCTGDKTATCDTHCCDSDECNAPPNGTAMIIPQVDPARAITCYQYIGYRVEKVQCLFENARCLHLEIAPWDIDLSHGSQTKEYKEALYCSLSEHCATVKNIFCDAYSRSKGYQWSYLLREKCSIDCCSSNRCNSGRYGGKPKESEIPKYDHKRITHSWDGYRNYKTMTTTTRKPTPRYYEKGSFDTPVVISGRFAKFAIGIGISVVLFVIIVVLKCAKGLKRTTRKTRSSKTSTQLTGYNRGERV